MNHYLAFCHALSLLEQPISAKAFAAAVAKAGNPLFDSACSRPQHFLRVLQHEGVLQLQQGRFQLQGAGLLLYSQVLNWSARDKAAIQARRARQPAPPPLVICCAQCGSRFCGLHLTLGLLQRVYSGLASWQAWSASEVALLHAVLRQQAAAAIVDHSQLLTPADALPGCPAGWSAAALAACLQKSATRRCLPVVLDRPQVSRLHLDYGLMPEYPKPLLRVSQIGFSDDGQQAVLWYTDTDAPASLASWNLWRFSAQGWQWTAST
ncbi:MAG: hypothetical protein IGS03_18710 [Candidatus Sericytochromatia bacterium]|nr:hypothetical protein [Candidatus Sericytochromatia bacterium]